MRHVMERQRVRRRLSRLGWTRLENAVKVSFARFARVVPRVNLGVYSGNSGAARPDKRSNGASSPAQPIQVRPVKRNDSLDGLHNWRDAFCTIGATHFAQLVSFRQIAQIQFEF